MTAEATAGDTHAVRVSWEHPQAWKRLRSVRVLVRSQGIQIGAVELITASGKPRATGSVRVAGKVVRHGKRVTATMNLQPAAAFDGKLTLDVLAVDRKGQRQFEAGVAEI